MHYNTNIIMYELLLPALGILNDGFLLFFEDKNELRMTSITQCYEFWIIQVIPSSYLSSQNDENPSFKISNQHTNTSWLLTDKILWLADVALRIIIRATSVNPKKLGRILVCIWCCNGIYYIFEQINFFLNFHLLLYCLLFIVIHCFRAQISVKFIWLFYSKRTI